MSNRGEVMFALHHHQPMTPKEVGDVIDESGNNASTMLHRMHSEELLIRRTRPTEKSGRDPYEYAIKPIEDWE